MSTAQQAPAQGPGDYQLTENQPMRISDAMGSVIECLSGTAWITSYGERSDFMLRAGMAFEVPTNGLTLIEAVGAGKVRVTAPVAAAQPWYRALASLARAH